MKPGIHNIPAPQYHADPCPSPSLSNSIAKLLLERSPRHAWQAHPRLNPAFEPDNNRDFDLGKAAHALLLEGAKNFAVIDADSYRTKAAKASRDDALDAGRYPVLAEQWETVLAMVSAAQQQLAAAHDECASFLHEGMPEITMVWQEEGTWCRALADWLPIQHHAPIWDYKTTGGSANPDYWMSQVFNLGFDMQAAFYLRGIRAIRGADAAREGFRFIVQETSPPYALAIVGLTPAALAMADRKIDRALEIWRQCLLVDQWPGYPARTCFIDPPGWHEQRWLEREEREDAATSHYGKTMVDMSIDWQAPL